MKNIASGIYIVQSKDDFEKAVATEFEENYGTWKWYMSRMVYPQSYPSLVSLSIGYCGDTYFHCNAVPISVLSRDI